MPRPKGSKNKTKKTAATKDYAALISEKQAEKEAIAEEVNAKTATVMQNLFEKKEIC